LGRFGWPYIMSSALCRSGDSVSAVLVQEPFSQLQLRLAHSIYLYRMEALYGKTDDMSDIPARSSSSWCTMSALAPSPATRSRTALASGLVKRGPSFPSVVLRTNLNSQMTAPGAVQVGKPFQHHLARLGRKLVTGMLVSRVLSVTAQTNCDLSARSCTPSTALPFSTRGTTGVSKRNRCQAGVRLAIPRRLRPSAGRAPVIVYVALEIFAIQRCQVEGSIAHRAALALALNRPRT
jgi:hypothetical protein